MVVSVATSKKSIPRASKQSSLFSSGSELFAIDDKVLSATVSKFVLGMSGLGLMGIGCSLVLDSFLGSGIGFLITGMFFFMLTLAFELLAVRKG